MAQTIVDRSASSNVDLDQITSWISCNSDIHPLHKSVPTFSNLHPPSQLSLPQLNKPAARHAIADVFHLSRGPTRALSTKACAFIKRQPWETGVPKAPNFPEESCILTRPRVHTYSLWLDQLKTDLRKPASLSSRGWKSAQQPFPFDKNHGLLLQIYGGMKSQTGFFRPGRIRRQVLAILRGA